MVIKTKFPYPLLLWFFFTVYFSSGLLSLCYQIPRQRTDVDRCIDQCRQEEKDVPGLFACAARCDRKYAGTTPWELGGSPGELLKCQKRCEWEESGRRQHQQCKQRCGEEVREREQERQREQVERERENREQEQRERQEREEIKQKREREREQRNREEREQREEEEEEEEEEEIERQREWKREERERDREHEREVSPHDYSSRDPEEKFEQCMQLCKKQPARQEPQCKKRYKRQYEGTKRNLQQEGKNQLLRGSGDAGEENYPESRQPYEQCRKQCKRQERGKQHQQQCKSWCEQQKQNQKRRRNSKQNSQGEEQQERNNPYYFHAQRFHYLFKSQEGHIKVLQRFSERSQLLNVIDNYRLVIVETNPSTLLLPHHSDAETILVVVRGKGIVTLVSQEKRETFNLGLGDVFRIPAGVIVYLINQENNEKLQLAMLFHPVNTPGQFRKYFAAGGGNPESYYRVFSNDILQRALNTPSDQLKRLFEGEQRQHGAIRRAAPEQLKALSQHVTPKKPSSESSGPFNLLSKQPLYHNNFGRFFEVTPNENPKQLQELGVSVTYVDINQGGMIVPHYNSKTTTIVLVIEGRGRLEMGCPHLSHQGQGSQEPREQSEEEESSGQLQKITAELSPGDVFIIPAGHPIALVAQNENLRTVGFGINAMNNQRNFLAGKINIMNQVEREAMEIAFNVPARLIERIFSDNPKESYFVAGPELARPEEEQQRGEGKEDSLASVLDLVGF